MQTVYNTIPQPNITATEKERHAFNSMFISIVNDLTDCYNDIPEAKNYYVDVLNVNVSANKQATGLTVVSAYKAFSSPGNLTPRSIFLANILGWCVNFMICASQIITDITDGSKTRHGLPCWYRNQNVGLLAIVDGVFIERSPYIILKKYFFRDDLYLTALEWIHNVTVKSTDGRTLDNLNKKNGRPHLDSFTKERFNIIAKYRTTYLSLLSPIILAMKFAKRNDVMMHNKVQSILLVLGNYLHAQNNMSDCYGDPFVTGKTSRDIQEGKCTWLIVRALEKTTPREKEIMERHYGKEHPESISEIKRLYGDMGLFEDFLEFEKKSYNYLTKRACEMPDEFPKEYFLKFIGSFYNHSTNITTKVNSFPKSSKTNKYI